MRPRSWATPRRATIGRAARRRTTSSHRGSSTLDRRFRKALFTLAREAADREDLSARFEAFIAEVRAVPPGDRPYSDEVRDILRGLSLRLDLVLQLQRRYDEARVGRARQPA